MHVKLFDAASEEDGSGLPGATCCAVKEAEGRYVVNAVEHCVAVSQIPGYHHRTVHTVLLYVTKLV